MTSYPLGARIVSCHYIAQQGISSTNEQNCVTSFIDDSLGHLGKAIVHLKQCFLTDGSPNLTLCKGRQ